MFGPFKKEKPMMGLTSLGGGGTNIALGGAALVQSATGGDKYVEGSYTIHKYLSSTPAPESTFVNDGTVPISATYIAVGGGGGSNSGHGGAGGGGGVLTNIPGLMPATTAIPDIPAGTTVPITVGAGGAADDPGADSVIAHPGGSLTAIGGGKGAGLWEAGGNGGSGGGGAYASPGGGSGTAGQGNDGGAGHVDAPYGGGGGGGGAGATGGASPQGGSNIGGKGGTGVTIPTIFQQSGKEPSPFGWDIAGGGGGSNAGNILGYGGGGGNGSPGNPSNPIASRMGYGAGWGGSPNPGNPGPERMGGAGTDNTGGGGGGGGVGMPPGPGWDGGSGLVLIAYETA